jgi:hypothetical protein
MSTLVAPAAEGVSVRKRWHVSVRDLAAFAVVVSLFVPPSQTLAAKIGPRLAPALSQVPLAGRRAVGLGPVLSSKFGGGIFGWDMNQSGNDGVFTEYATPQSGSFFAIETFNETTATVTKVVHTNPSPGGNDEPFPEAILGNDIGFIDVERVIFKNSQVQRNDRFELMNPVSNNKITGPTKPPKSYDVVTSFVTKNQNSSTQAMMVGYFGGKRIQPELYLFDSAKNSWLEPYVFPRDQVFAGYLLYAGIDVPSNQAFVGYQSDSISYSPYEPPSFDVFDGRSGKLLRTFQGIGSGPLAGMAIDSTTGIMCTTTLHDMNVEFYKVKTGKGFFVTIPGGGGALTNGADVAVDQVNHLFLVAQLNSTFAPGSTVIVYDEKGNLIETINGLSFLDRFSPLVVRIAANGTTRTGYAPGPNPNNLQSFTY